MNRRRVLLVIAQVLAFATVAEALTIRIFWLATWTPFERHYLAAYIWCSLPAVSPGTVEVRWIWETGRHRKQQLATDDDAIGSDDGTSMVLSQSARDAGWKALIEGPPEQVPTDLLRPDLAHLAFEDQSLWNLFLFPELSALAALCVALCVWFLGIGFLRALIAEYGWRRRVYSRQELLSTVCKDCTALAQTVCSGLAALYPSRARHIEPHLAAASTKVLQIQPRAPACILRASALRSLQRNREGVCLERKGRDRLNEKTARTVRAIEEHSACSPYRSRFRPARRGCITPENSLRSSRTTGPGTSRVTANGKGGSPTNGI